MACRHAFQVNLSWFAGFGKEDLLESVKDIKVVCDRSVRRVAEYMPL